MELNTSLAFDQGKQAAIFGWMLRDDLFCMQCMTSIKFEWFSDPHVGKLFSAAQSIFDKYHRRPTPQELEQWRPFLQEETRTRERLVKTIADCLKTTSSYPLDALRDEMTSWMRAVIFAQSVGHAVDLYNAKKVDDAWTVMEDATLLKTSANFEDGINLGFDDATKRIVDERAERLAQSTRVLQYGVGFLDDALGGIIPNDLIVIGAKTGAGKTQLATSVALHNAQAGHPVYYFALEAENNEIERRIKYGYISNEYYRTAGIGDPVISYTDWRMGRLEKLLGPIEERLTPTLVETVRNLNTLYRTSGNFDLKALERNLMKIVSKARLIVIDHLHYIDTNADDENSAYKRTIKLIRDIVLRYGVPIIVIAHLRKTQGGNGSGTLVPLIEEFHGTSDVPKIATTCIMMSPAGDHVAPEPYLWPTYIGCVKSRLDGSRTRFVGLTHFDARKARYKDDYRISAGPWEWEDLLGKAVPHWARHSAGGEGDDLVAGSMRRP